jgi:hypothetical protein
MAKHGKTTGNLKMRSGPGMQFEPPIAYLVPNTDMEILGEEGDWWKVRAAGKEGYVGKKYVAVTETPAAEAAAPTPDKTAEGVAKEPAKTLTKSGMVKTGGAKPSTVKAGTGQPGATKRVGIKSTGVKSTGIKSGVVKQTPTRPNPIKPSAPKPGRPRGGINKK